MPNWVDAQFDTPTGPVTVGPFDSEAEADEFGELHNCPEARYTGTARRLGRQELGVEIAKMKAGPAAESRKHTGVVSRWSGSSGFATDPVGVSWFISRDDLPGGRMELSLGTRITFSGSPFPAPGKKYPRAYSIQLTKEIP
jgi:hypothetical protein